MRTGETEGEAADVVESLETAYRTACDRENDFKARLRTTVDMLLACDDM